MKPQPSAAQKHRFPWDWGLLHGRPAARERPEVTFQEFAGAEEARAACRVLVDFLKDPQKYHRLGVQAPRKVLLAGPPGTGKKLLARAVAGEARVPLFMVEASDLAEPAPGKSPFSQRFSWRRAAGPAVLFIDRLDMYWRRRGASLAPMSAGQLHALRNLMDQMKSFESSQGWIVFAATRHPGELDPALFEPGFFDLQLPLGLPDRRSREGILLIHTRPLRLGRDVDLSLLARTTTGFSGANLANLCREAALVAALQDRPLIGMADFEEALDHILLWASSKLLLSDEERRVAAYHEAGHAVVGWLTPYAVPAQGITLLPRGRALGAAGLLSGDDRYSYSRAALLARLAVMLGGRAAEELATGDVTTAAQDDLQQATRLARQMVACWGMGSLGPVALDLGAAEEQDRLGGETAAPRCFSEATAAQIDRDIQKLLTDRYLEVQRFLVENRSRLDQVARVLLDEETIGHETLARMLGPRLSAGIQPGLPVESDVSK